ncbi:MAG: LVIVD repeat-containing protein, partial [bacterium]
MKRFSRRTLAGALALTAPAVSALAVPCDDHSAYQTPVHDSAMTGTASSLHATGGLLCAAAGEHGLRILLPSEPGRFVELGAAATSGPADALWVDGDRAYVTMPGRLEIFDVAVPGAPSLLGSMDFPPPVVVLDVVVHGHVAYVATSHGVWLLDVGDPSAPVQLSTFDGRPLYGTTSVAVQETVMYVGVGPDRILTVDVSDPSAPGEIGEYDTNANDVLHMSADGDWLIAIADDVLILDARTPSALAPWASIGTAHTPASAVAFGDRLFVTQDASASLLVVDVSVQGSPVALGWVPLDAAGPLALADGYVVAGVPEGLAAVDTGDIVFAPTIAPPLVPPMSGDGRSVHVLDRSMYVSSGRVFIYDVTEPALPELISAPIGYGNFTGGV